jgi:hypothetical protein
MAKTRTVSKKAAERHYDICVIGGDTYLFPGKQAQDMNLGTREIFSYADKVVSEESKQFIVERVYKKSELESLSDRFLAFGSAIPKTRR